MARIGYARVSTLDQDLDVQLAKLKAEGCGVIRSEKVSGGSREGRTELATVLEFLRPGDELVVTRLDRLGRDTRDVLNLIHEAEQRDAFVTVLDPHVSTRGEMGHIVLTVLGMVAQMERRFIKERQRDGIERAKGKACTQAENGGSTATGSERCTLPVVVPRQSHEGARLLPYAGLPSSPRCLRNSPDAPATRNPNRRPPCASSASTRTGPPHPGPQTGSRWWAACTPTHSALWWSTAMKTAA